MKKFWRGFRRAADRHERQDAAKVRDEQLEKLRYLLEVGGHEAELEYSQLLKDWQPGISNAELAEKIRLYHDAVSARQLRDRESR